MKKLYVIGIGPGGEERLTDEAKNALEESEVIVGYGPYLEYIKRYTEGKETFQTPMRGEIERCKKAIEFAKEGKTVSIVSTGDAGLYGMAGPILELGACEDLDIKIIPGITGAFSVAADLGAPIMHDCCFISLSDLLTPWDLIMKRVELAASGDFVICIYNPKSRGRQDHLEEAIDMIIRHKSPETPVGVVKNSGREGTEICVTSLGSLNYENIDMKTLLIVGNKATYVENGYMITPRGYNI